MKLNKNNYFKAIIFALIFIIPFYEYYLKGNLLNLFSNREDVCDIIYYNDIFSNGSLSLIIILFLSILIFSLRNYFWSLLKKYSAKDILILLLIFQIFFQLSVILLVHTVPISDSIYYLDHGKRLYETGKYISIFGNYTAFWPVGLPSIIAFFYYLGFEAIFMVKLFNIFCSSLLLIILYNIFSKILNQNQLKLFMILFTLFPNNLFASQVILTELPFTLLTWCAIYYFVKNIGENKRINLFFIGALVGLSTFVRANGIILLFTLIIVLFIKERSFNQIIYLVLGFTIVLLPWVYRNYLHFNSFILSSTNGGYIFLMGNNQYSNGKVNFNFDYNLSNPDEPAEESKAYKKGFEFIQNNFGNFLILTIKKLFYSYWRGDSSITWSFKKTENFINPQIKSFIFFITNFYYYLILLFSFLALLKYKRLSNIMEYNLIFMILMIINLIMIAVYVGSERYFIHLLPIYFYLAGKYINEY
ncbi:MAG: glycosyltransferase family 39 protein [Thermoplasmata archaeon]